MEARHFMWRRFLRSPGGNSSEHVHRVNASSAMGERCLVEDPNSRGRVYMPTRVKRGKKSASKTSSKKSASDKHSTSRNSKKSSTGKRVTAKKSGRKRSPGGI